MLFIYTILTVTTSSLQ